MQRSESNRFVLRMTLSLLTKSTIAIARSFHRQGRVLHYSTSALLTHPRVASQFNPGFLLTVAAKRWIRMSQHAGSFPSFTTVNFYAGSKLNRLSWLRSSTEFLNSTIASANTRFVLLKHNNPLCHASGQDEGLLVTLSWSEVKQYVLENVKLSGGVKTEGDNALVFGPQAYGLNMAEEASGEKDFIRSTDGMGPNRLALIFLGIDETELSETSLPGQMANDASKTSDAANDKAPPAGVPYFALSLTYRPSFLSDKESLPMQELLDKLHAHSDKYDFIDLRASSRAATWPKQEAAIVAQAKALIDWNERHHFCPGCSRQQYSLWAGYKRGCSSSLSHATPGSHFSNAFLANGKYKTFQEDGKGICPSTKVLSNYQYPRTDPVIIMAIISPDGEKVLLGRQKKWPKGFYSCLAGFCEPGESFEEAVRREVLEEAGVLVDQVIYHSSQPWPYPTNLMAGFYGIAKTDDPNAIRLDLDNELENAVWYTRQQVVDVISSKTKSHFTRDELAKIEKQHHDNDDKTSEQQANVDIRLPPHTAIARVLIEAWANGQAILPIHMNDFQKTCM